MVIFIYIYINRENQRGGIVLVGRPKYLSYNQSPLEQTSLSLPVTRIFRRVCIVHGPGPFNRCFVEVNGIGGPSK